MIIEFNTYSPAEYYKADLRSQFAGRFQNMTQENGVEESLKLLTTKMEIQQKDQSSTSNYVKGQFKQPENEVGGKATLMRVIYQRPLEQVYKKVMNDYFLLNEAILEIGAGQQKSALNSVLNSNSSNWKRTFSDLTYQSTEGSVDNQRIPLDITQLPPAHLSNQFDGIVGNNVLDMLDYRTLPAVFKNMNHLLKEKGTFIHFADLAFFAPAFLDACVEEGKEFVLLPAGPYIKYMYRIDKKDYESVLKSKKKELNTQEKEILLRWGQQPIQVQVAVLSQAQSLAFIHLAERIKSIFDRSKSTLLDAQVLFEGYLRASAVSVGWEVVQCGYVSGVCEEQPYPGEESNYWYLKQGHSMDDFHESVPDCKVRRQADVHVFVAKRKKVEGKLKVV